MGHPMEGAYAERGAARDRLWARRDALEARINMFSLGDFGVAQLPDLQLLYDRTAPSKHIDSLERALDRLETWLKLRTGQ